MIIGIAMIVAAALYWPEDDKIKPEGCGWV